MISRGNSLNGVLLALPVLLTVSGGCDIAMMEHHETATAEWRKSYELADGGRVEVGNTNGKIDVRPSTGSTVEIVARKISRAATQEDARRGLERIEIRESTSGGAIKVDTHVPRTGGMFSDSGLSVEYELRVPASADVKLTTVNGGVEVSGINGRVVAETTNGGVKGRELGGTVEASTTNGGVDVDVTRVGSDGIKLECTNGGIDLRLPADANASIAARVTNGGIDTSGLSLSVVESSRRRLDADLNGGGARVSLEGTNGGIRISAR